MNITRKNYITSLIYMGCLASASLGYAGTMGDVASPSTGKIYVGAFGGGAGMSTGNMSQKGTAFLAEASGGPLAVNARGKSNDSSTWLVGGHVGYRWSSNLLENLSSEWMMAPATELEGFYLGRHTLKGSELNNGTTRLIEHNFHVSYPMSTGVFLVNAILNGHSSKFEKFHPYVGVGVGTAINPISGAVSTQLDPSEPGVNHYNSDTSDTALLLAAQPKVGVSFDVNQNMNVFAEYRFLYLSSSDYTFGSTVYPTHVATSNWNVKMGSQYYNMGTIGINYDL